MGMNFMLRVALVFFPSHCREIFVSPTTAEENPVSWIGVFFVLKPQHVSTWKHLKMMTWNKRGNLWFFHGLIFRGGQPSPLHAEKLLLLLYIGLSKLQSQTPPWPCRNKFLGRWWWWSIDVFFRFLGWGVDGEGIYIYIIYTQKKHQQPPAGKCGFWIWFDHPKVIPNYTWAVINKNFSTFHYTGWFMGIHIMAYKIIPIERKGSISSPLVGGFNPSQKY